MPIFEYKCNHCENEFEKIVFGSDETEVSCPECDSRDVQKKMSATSFMAGSSVGKCAAGAPGGFS